VRAAVGAQKPTRSIERLQARSDSIGGACVDLRKPKSSSTVKILCGSTARSAMRGSRSAAGAVPGGIRTTKAKIMLTPVTGGPLVPRYRFAKTITLKAGVPGSCAALPVQLQQSQTRPGRCVRSPSWSQTPCSRGDQLKRVDGSTLVPLELSHKGPTSVCICFSPDYEASIDYSDNRL